MNSLQNHVFVVEDDPSMRNALKNLLRSVGLESRQFASAQEFLEADRPDGPRCLILDVRLPGLSGLDLQKELARAGIEIPIIFITAHGDIPMSVRAMKAGAVEFLTKPFRDQDLLDAIHAALMQDRVRRQNDSVLAELKRRFESLTSRERELLSLIISGRSNKHVAAEIGTSEITVKVHRRHLMQKMRAASFADLLRMAADLKIPYTKV
ncbi:MAG TPA: response regulator [Terriglobia bacterium]|nr:response regulator [Terriglobia bacterium]